MFGEPEPEESSRSLTDRSLCVCVCVCMHARIITFREPLNALPLFLQPFRDLQYLLWALSPKGNILGLMYVTCYLKHAAACGPLAHDRITDSHAKCEQISACSHGHFSLVRHHLPHYSFILCMAQQGLFLWCSRGFCTVGMCRNVSAAFQAGYQPGEARAGGGLEVSCASPVPPPSWSCHVSRGVPPLSFTPVWFRSGASVRSRNFYQACPPSYTMYASQCTCNLTTQG